MFYGGGCGCLLCFCASFFFLKAEARERDSPLRREDATTRRRRRRRRRRRLLVCSSFAFAKSFSTHVKKKENLRKKARTPTALEKNGEETTTTIGR